MALESRSVCGEAMIALERRQAELHQQLEDEDPISPNEFAERMTILQSDDNESAHSSMDEAMCDLLESFGYEEGVTIFRGQTKYYG